MAAAPLNFTPVVAAAFVPARLPALLVVGCRGTAVAAVRNPGTCTPLLSLPPGKAPATRVSAPAHPKRCSPVAVGPVASCAQRRVGSGGLAARLTTATSAPPLSCRGLQLKIIHSRVYAQVRGNGLPGAAGLGSADPCRQHVQPVNSSMSAAVAAVPPLPPSHPHPLHTHSSACRR